LATDVSGQPIGPILNGQTVSVGLHNPSKMGLIGCPETTVTNYKPTFSNIQEEGKPQVHDGGI